MQNQTQHKLFCKTEKIVRGDLISMQINLLNACPSRCKSCRRYEWPKDTLPYGKLKELIIECKNHYDIETIIFSGGDPICYPELEKAMHLCTDLGIEFSLISTLITNDNERIKSIATMAERLHVSLDSVNKEGYKEIRGVDAFDIVEKNVATIQEIRKLLRKQPIRFSMTVSKLNYKEAFNVYEFAKKYGCHINFYYLHTWDDMKLDGKQREEFQNIMEKIINDNNISESPLLTNAADFLKEEVQVNNSNAGCKRCRVSYIHCAVNADGSIFPCCKLFNENACYEDSIKYACGNIFDGDIIKQLEKRKDGNYPLDVQECKDCMPCYYEIVNPYVMNVLDNYGKKVFI